MPASTVTEYLAALPADRRDALNEVRRGMGTVLESECLILKLKLEFFRLHLFYEHSE